MRPRIEDLFWQRDFAASVFIRMKPPFRTASYFAVEAMLQRTDKEIKNRIPGNNARIHAKN